MRRKTEESTTPLLKKVPNKVKVIMKKTRIHHHVKEKLSTPPQ